LELSHVVSCLNKLDFGSPERICLMSRDEQNVIIVSYADLKSCFEATFQQLLEASLQLPHNFLGDEFSRMNGRDATTENLIAARGVGGYTCSGHIEED
jgi:hypothetical protein